MTSGLSLFLGRVCGYNWHG